jgi:hypothetical protein
LRWLPREPPLACAAVAAVDQAGERLRQAAAGRLAAGGRLRAAANDEWVIVLGDPVDLPWIEGALYLGWASGVLVPTTLAPSVPADLLRRSVTRDVGDLVVMVPGAVLVSPMPVRPADPDLLARR